MAVSFRTGWVRLVRFGDTVSQGARSRGGLLIVRHCAKLGGYLESVEGKVEGWSWGKEKFEMD